MTNPFRVAEAATRPVTNHPYAITRLPGGIPTSGPQARAMGQVLDDAAQLTPVQMRQGPGGNAPGAPARAGVDPTELALDLTQIGLDIVGIFEPTPFADGANTLMSWGRGDFWGGVMSAAGMIPYVGDLAKLGKMGKWAKTVANAVEMASSSPALARKLEPGLKAIKEAVDAIPQAALDNLPKEAREAMVSMKSKLDDFFTRGADDVGQAAARRDVTVLRRHADGNMQVLVDGKRYNLPPGKTVDDIPLTDAVGDKLQELTTDAASRWDPARNLSRAERDAIDEARALGEHWRANLLEKQAKGRWVEKQVKEAAEVSNLDVDFSRVGLDVTSGTGAQYDIMSGTVSNMDVHARREPDKLFRMITFE
jgi:hypothetical protein